MVNEDFVHKLISGTLGVLTVLKIDAVSAQLEVTISALANTGGGYIIFGVNDDGTIVGLQPNQIDQTIENLKTISHSMSVSLEIQTFSIEGKSIVLYHVFEKTTDFFIRTSDGKAYQRVGDQNRLVDNNQLKRSQKKSKREIRCFVAMSFREQEYPRLLDFYDAMQRAALRCYYNLKVERNDEDPFNGDAMARIHNKIKDCDFMVADYTLNSTNVYYEEGYAAGKGKEVIQTAENGTDLAFDINHNNTYTYSNAHQLEEQLVDSFNEICKRIKPKRKKS